MSIFYEAIHKHFVVIKNGYEHGQKNMYFQESQHNTEHIICDNKIYIKNKNKNVTKTHLREIIFVKLIISYIVNKVIFI